MSTVQEEIELHKAKLIDAFTTYLNQFYQYGAHDASDPTAACCKKCKRVIVKVPTSFRLSRMNGFMVGEEEPRLDLTGWSKVRWAPGKDPAGSEWGYYCPDCSKALFECPPTPIS